MKATEKANYVLITNPSACIGCRTCELVCSFYHYKEHNPARALLQVVKNESLGIDVPVVCRHCNNPPCLTSCPSGAIKKDTISNVVLIDEKKCIGCRNCLSACPFGAIRIDPKSGDVKKCDLCNGNPQCALMCKQGAIQYLRRDLAARAKAHSSGDKTVKLLTKNKIVQESKG